MCLYLLNSLQAIWKSEHSMIHQFRLQRLKGENFIVSYSVVGPQLTFTELQTQQCGNKN